MPQADPAGAASTGGLGWEPARGEASAGGRTKPAGGHGREAEQLARARSGAVGGQVAEGGWAGVRPQLSWVAGQIQQAATGAKQNSRHGRGGGGGRAVRMARSRRGVAEASARRRAGAGEAWAPTRGRAENAAACRPVVGVVRCEAAEEAGSEQRLALPRTGQGGAAGPEWATMERRHGHNKQGARRG